ncbi:MAG: hypothetical protein ACYCZY_09725 [Lacisediminihabitans sp.]
MTKALVKFGSVEGEGCKGVAPLLRREGDLKLSDSDAALLVCMSAATIDRKFAPERVKMMSRGR